MLKIKKGVVLKVKLIIFQKLIIFKIKASLMINKALFILVFAFCTGSIGYSQSYDYEPSAEHPFGLPNPEAPPQIVDFSPIIGECDCQSVRRNPDQSWGEPVKMTWRFKYIMNGMAVQDETLKADGIHSGSIRQFNVDSSRWYVHYYTSGSASSTLRAWEGNKNEQGDIVLYNEQKAPNGMDGFFKITFSEMSGTGFKWLGEWVSKDESISFPTWKIDCIKTSFENNEIEKEKILANTKKFSQAYMNEDYDAIANAYTLDGKIFPNNTKIIEGREAIKKRWIITNGAKILHHQLDPEEIKFLGDYAYDYGYYNGKTQNKDKTISEWKGKYVVIWKKVGEDWKMYLDIWNRVNEQ
jgi:ketosteroid isomerase-like protein